MVKPVTGLTVWGATTSGTTTQLDNNFTSVTTALNDLNTYGNFLTDTGSANAVIVTLGANLTGALTDGLPIQVKVAATNTGGSTLNYNGGGAKNILNMDGTALVAGELVTGGIYQFQYRASDTSWLLQTPTASGAVGTSMVLLRNVQANANTTIDFNALITGTYDNYRLLGSGVKVAGNNSQVTVRVGNGNSSAGGYQATGYDWSGLATAPGAGSGTVGSNGNATAFFISSSSDGVYNGANSALNFTFEIGVVANANAPAPAIVHASYLRAVNTNSLTFFASGFWSSNSPVTSLQVAPSNANFTSGNFALYGIRKS